jgi:hypothetical protein
MLFSFSASRFFFVPLRLCVKLFVFYFALFGGNLPRLCHAMAKMPQQRQPPSLSPRVRHYGGCPRVCRRILWRKWQSIAAVPVFAAVHFGDNSANPATGFFLLSTFHFLLLTALSKAQIAPDTGVKNIGYGCRVAGGDNQVKQHIGVL